MLLSRSLLSPSTQLHIALPSKSPLLLSFELLTLALHQPLYIRDTLRQDLLQHLGVLQLLGHLGDDAVGQFLLLTLLDLSFVADPAV